MNTAYSYCAIEDESKTFVVSHDGGCRCLQVLVFIERVYYLAILRIFLLKSGLLSIPERQEKRKRIYIRFDINYDMLVDVECEVAML